MVHAATAYAKQSGRLGIFACTTSIGPGATNMVTGAATATINRLPVLLLPGRRLRRSPARSGPAAARAPRRGRRLGQRLLPSGLALLRSHPAAGAARAARCSAPSRVLTDPVETGAVTICLAAGRPGRGVGVPGSLVRAARLASAAAAPPTPSTSLPPSPRSRGAKRPLLVAGGGVHYSFADRGARSGSRPRDGIPVAETQAGKSARRLDASDERRRRRSHRHAGREHARARGRRRAVRRQSRRPTSPPRRRVSSPSRSSSAFTSTSTRSTPRSSERCRWSPTPGSGLEALDAALGAWTTRARRGESASPSFVERWRSEVDRLYALPAAGGSDLPQTTVLGRLDAALGERDVIVCAAGSLPGDLHRLWRPRAERGYHLEYGYSCMGYEVAGALGAKLAEPEREVWALVGDGSFLMLHSELVTALQEGVPIRIVLFDNRGLPVHPRAAARAGLRRLRQRAPAPRAGRPVARRGRLADRLRGLRRGAGRGDLSRPHDRRARRGDPGGAAFSARGADRGQSRSGEHDRRLRRRGGASACRRSRAGARSRRQARAMREETEKRWK